MSQRIYVALMVIGMCLIVGGVIVAIIGLLVASMAPTIAGITFLMAALGLALFLSRVRRITPKKSKGR